MTESWLRNGVCRCCHFEGVFTSLEDTFKAEPVDMTLGSLLKETLDVDITSVSGKLGTKLNTICDDCIPRLWDAAVFRKQILACEKKFNDFINNHTDSDMEMKEQNKEEKWIIGYEDSNDEEEKTEDKYSDDVHFIHVTNEDDDDDEKSETKYNDDEKLDDQITQPVTDGDDDLQNCYEELDDDFQWPAEDDNENEYTKSHQIGIKNFNCTVCQKECSSQKTLQSHMKIHARGNHTCGMCGVEYRLRKELMHHMTDEHKGQYPCKKCNEVFNDAKLLKYHLSIHTRNTKHKYSEYKIRRNETKKRNKNKTIHICDICNKSYSNSHLLLRHKLTHTGQSDHMCDICEKSFSQSSHLIKHIRFMHSGVKPYSCEVCDERFSKKSELVMHGRVHRGVAPCATCELNIAHNYFVPHKCNRRGAHPYWCHICDKVLTSNAYFEIHMRSHLDRPFVCNVCGEKFTQKMTFQKHVRTHTGERPYACDVCKKRFVEKCHLKVHIMRLHLQERPYSCSVCNRSFSDSGNLKRHLLVHTGNDSKTVKYVTCNICKKQVTHIKRHMQLHDNNEFFYCPVCNKQFEKQLYLTRHMKVHD